MTSRTGLLHQHNDRNFRVLPRCESSKPGIEIVRVLVVILVAEGDQLCGSGLATYVKTLDSGIGTGASIAVDHHPHGVFYKMAKCCLGMSTSFVFCLVIEKNVGSCRFLKGNEVWVPPHLWRWWPSVAPNCKGVASKAPWPMTTDRVSPGYQISL